MHAIEWVILIVVIAGAIIAILGLDRYRGSKKTTASNDSAEPTDEMFVDQDTGRRMRVWFNPETGEREYRPE